MAFTTWADLHKSMLDDMASGNWRVASYTIGSREMRYRSFEEFRDALDYVEIRAAMERGEYTTSIEAVRR